MTSKILLKLTLSLILGTIFVGALSGHAQTTNVIVDATKPWEGYQNYHDTYGENGGGYVVPNTADLRAKFTPSRANATRLVLQMNTNTYKLDGTNNLPDGTPNRIYESDFYVNALTNFGGLTVSFSGTVESNTLPTTLGTYAVAFIKEFTPPNYDYDIGSTEVPLNPGPFNVTQAIGAGNIAQYGFCIKGPNVAPNSPDAAAAVSILVSNKPVPTATVTVDPTKKWTGYLSYFTLDNGFLKGFSIAASNLPAVFIPNQASATRLILGINTSTYDATVRSPFSLPVNSFNNPDGTPNKNLEANFYVEENTHGGQAMTFQGSVESNGIPAGWTAYAMIKEFMSAYGFVGITTAPLTPGAFSVTRLIAPGNISQYGFYVYGPNTAPGSPNSAKKISILSQVLRPM